MSKGATMDNCGTLSGGQFKSYLGGGAKLNACGCSYGPLFEAMFGTVRTLLDKHELLTRVKL